MPENKVIFEKVEHKEFLKNKIGAISKAWKPYQDLKINDIIAYDIYSVNYYDIKHFSFETGYINNKKTTFEVESDSIRMCGDVFIEKINNEPVLTMDEESVLITNQHINLHGEIVCSSVNNDSN